MECARNTEKNVQLFLNSLPRIGWKLNTLKIEIQLFSCSENYRSKNFFPHRKLNLRFSTSQPLFRVKKKLEYSRLKKSNIENRNHSNLFHLCTPFTSYLSSTTILFYCRKLLEGNKNQFFSLLTGSTVPQLLSITAKILALYGYKNEAKADVIVVKGGEKENQSLR
jgi:hypothetical protein